MELPFHPSWVQPTAYSCSLVFHRQSALCSRKTAIASQRSLLSLKSLDFAAPCTFRASLQPANNPSSRIKGKRSKPNPVSSPIISNTSAVSRNKEGAIARERFHHHGSSESANYVTKLTDSKAPSSVVSLKPANNSSSHIKAKHHKPNSVSSHSISNTTAVSRNKEGAIAHEQGATAREQFHPSESAKCITKPTNSKAPSSVVLTSKSRRKDTSAREGSDKGVSSRETHSHLVVSSESRAKQVCSQANGGKINVDPGLFEKGSGSSVFPKECATIKDLSLCKSRRRKASFSTLSPTQLEEEKARKLQVWRERVAMAEANGLRLSKRAKKNPEELQLVMKLNLCSKHGDLHGALEVYDMVKKNEIFNLKQHHYNVLLYICSGAAAGSLTNRKSHKDEKVSAVITGDGQKRMVKDPGESIDRASKGEGEDAANLDVVSFGPKDMQLAAKRGTEIYQDMLQAKIPANEATFTSVARLAVAKGDGDLAFETVKKMASANITPKLRSYGPALLCFCESNQVKKAFEVDDHMVAAGVLPDENLLEALLKLSIVAGLEEKIYSLLQRIRTTVRDVSPATVTTIERWFNSEAAAFAGKAKWEKPPSKQDIREATEAGGGGWHGLGWLGKGTWTTKRTNISKAGVCLSCGETLCTIDLDPHETDKFAKSVAELAMQREYNSHEFLAFQEWLKENGPFAAVLDGANIGMYNSALRGFNYKQVATVASAVKARNVTEKPPLIVLHRRRTLDRSPRSSNIIEGWISDNVLYSTPHGSNDDWYWLYAAVSCKCLLVTNDEMRDHIFELLGNSFFPKWKERHQVHFTFSANGLELLMPPPYSTVLQESQSGCWHIPQTGGDDVESPREWLCVTRSPMESTQLKSSTSVEKESMVLNGNIEESIDEPNTSTLFTKGSASLGSEAGHMLSAVYLQLEAAEKISNTTITYDI